jgi:hypothetical protein
VYVPLHIMMSQGITFARHWTPCMQPSEPWHSGRQHCRSTKGNPLNHKFYCLPHYRMPKEEQFICGRAKCLSREQCVGWNAKADALCSKSSLQVSRTVTSSFAWSWTIIVYEGIQDLGKWTQYSSFVLVFLWLCLINCCTLDVEIIASVWGLPNSPS